MPIDEKEITPVLAEAFRSAPDALLVVDEEGTIQLTSTQTLALFGYTAEELIGQKVEILMPQRFRAHHVHQREGYTHHPYVRAMGANLNLFAQHKNGQEFAVEISLSPLKTSNKSYIIAALRDVREKKAQAQKLAERSKEIEQFVYIASHDLKEPINTIKQYLHALQEENHQALTSDGQTYLTRALASADRMTSLIHDLLDYALIGIKTNTETVNLNDVLADALHNLEHLITESHAVIHTQGLLPTLTCYRTECTLLFQNLLNNALKFRREGITPEVTITAAQKEGDYLFSISDNGIGIASDQIDKLFSLFKKLHSQSQYPGNGIGLCHCKKIVELHQGKIWIESTEGQGTTFFFTLKSL